MAKGTSDELTPKQRLAAYVEGRSYDRIPCYTFMGEAAARVTGITVAEYHLNAHKAAESQIAGYLPMAMMG